MPNTDSLSPTDAILRRFASEFQERFDRLLASPADIPPSLREAVRYAALGSGKRLRPYLVVRACDLVGGTREAAWPIAAAVECVHAFSLVHDDLPAMDNDDFRRGQPTCHRRFGQAMAILAGDALLILAFELITREAREPSRVATLVAELALGAGWEGMVGGQAADILGQTSPPTLSLAAYIHERKTAALFRAACRLGALAGGGTSEAVAALGEFGQSLGQAFQITDDLLDVTSTPGKIGKAVGKDEKASKQTYPRCVGREQSDQLARKFVDSAIDKLDRFGTAAEDLRRLARFVVDRDY